MTVATRTKPAELLKRANAHLKFVTSSETAAIMIQLIDHISSMGEPEIAQYKISKMLDYLTQQNARKRWRIIE